MEFKWNISKEQGEYLLVWVDWDLLFLIDKLSDFQKITLDN